MKAMLVISLALLATISNLSFAEQTSSSAHAEDLKTSTISGVVLDANNARIVGATIKIENAEFSRRVKSGDEGNFRVEIPAGLYQITAECQGFRRFELSPFRANASACELINIHMEVDVPKSTLKVH